LKLSRLISRVYWSW